MTEEHEEGHSHRLPASLLVFVAVIAIGLLAGIVLSYMDARTTERRLGALEEYVQGRGEFRDAEAARMEAEQAELVRRTACAILDGLPPSPLLDLKRAEFDCGPGVPIETLPPDVQQELGGGSPPSTNAPAVQAPQPPIGTPAVPVPPRTAPDQPATAPGEPPIQPSTPRPAPEPPAEPPPEPDGALDPLTDPLCQALFICL